jgi:hypothetical protein
VGVNSTNFANTEVQCKEICSTLSDCWFLNWSESEKKCIVYTSNTTLEKQSPISLLIYESVHFTAGYSTILPDQMKALSFISYLKKDDVALPKPGYAQISAFAVAFAVSSNVGPSKYLGCISMDDALNQCDLNPKCICLKRVTGGAYDVCPAGKVVTYMNSIITDQYPAYYQWKAKSTTFNELFYLRAMKETSVVLKKKDIPLVVSITLAVTITLIFLYIAYIIYNKQHKGGINVQNKDIVALKNPII